MLFKKNAGFLTKIKATIQYITGLILRALSINC